MFNWCKKEKKNDDEQSLLGDFELKERDRKKIEIREMVRIEREKFLAWQARDKEETKKREEEERKKREEEKKRERAAKK